ncbi:hypothetical protein VN24_21210 [Paenibacillus beijingensis]|uniref:Uncharacterized protein n=1 Tax=Paenibacillus beijingensis TaxID=1126833 RepID=A0A0D5NN01_9BACL|nr:hypothetical protein VN24_21210 [Paenibacillus beijingensis]
MSFSLDTPIYINTGRADLTEIKVDGQVIEDGDRPGSKKIQFDPSAPGTSGTSAADGGSRAGSTADSGATGSDTPSAGQ